MKIIISGAGGVGATIAEELARESHDITIIDTNDETLSRLSDLLDVMVVHGNGASFSVLRDAGAENADIIIAATESDELNMLCCQAAKALGTRYAIARIRDVDYTREVGLLQEKLGIDQAINPELSTAMEISRLLRFPAAANVETFCGGRVELISVRLREGDFLVGHSLASLSQHIRQMPFLFCAAQRGNSILIPNGSFVPQVDDKLYVIGANAGLTELIALLKRNMRPVRSVFIIGAGRVPYYLLQQMAAHHSRVKVKLVDEDEDRCRQINADFPKVLVINGDGTDQELLESEGMTGCDAFLALTDRDEDNLIACLYAAINKISLVAAQSSNENCLSIAGAVGLDSILSPKRLTADRILQVVRAMDSSRDSGVSALYRIAEGQVEAMQFEATENTWHLSVPLKDLPLRKGVLIACVLRGHQVVVPGGTTTIEAGDSVIIVSQERKIDSLNDIFTSQR